MLKISQLISLPIINIYGLKIEGYVEQVLFDTNTKKLEYLKIYDETSDSYKAVKYNNIMTISTSAIFIRNSSKITLCENVEHLLEKLSNPINTPAYILSGDYAGTVADIEIDNKGAINNITTTNTSYPTHDIIGFSNNVLLLSKDKVSIKKFKPYSSKIKQTISKISSDPVVSILGKTITPTREVTNDTFLLNRKVLKDIKNPNGEIIAKQNSIVTLNTLSKTKYYGKLKELALYSK